MTGPRPSAKDALASLRRKSAADALAELRSGADFSDVQGGASAPPKGPSMMDAAMERLPVVGGSLAMLRAVSGVAPSDVGREMVQGYSGNFADEAGLTDRDEVKRFRKESPLFALGSNVSGMAANPASWLAGPSRAAGLLAKIAQGAAGGAAIGGVASAGNAEGGLADRLPAAEQGAAAGAVVGGALPAVGAGLSKLPSAAKGMAGNAILRLLGVPPGVGRAASILRKLAAEGGEVAGTAAKTAEEIPFQPEVPAGRASSPDAMQAVADYKAGKISGDDLRTALDVAGGRTPVEPIPTVPDAPPPSPMPSVARETVAPVEPPDPIRPSGTVPRPRVGDTMLGAEAVEPGPYQKAAPNTRMQSPSLPSKLMERLASDPEFLAQQLELAQAFGGPNARAVEEVARLMAARSVP